MAANRFTLLADLQLPLRTLSEALSTIMALIQGPSRIHKGTDLEDSIQAFFGAVTSAMATHRRPGPTNLTFQRSLDHYWRRFDPHAARERPSRAELVQAKIAELKRASSPSEPVCFKCGDRGHIAAHCHNATLCFICNCHGHRSSQCCAIPSFELPKSSPLLSQNSTDTSPEPPFLPSQLTPAGPGKGQQSLPLVSDISIKRLEMKLEEIKQEMVVMEQQRSEMVIAMACINAQIHRSQSKLAEIEGATAAHRSAIREEKRCEDEIGTSIRSINRDAMCSEEVVHAIEVRQHKTMIPRGSKKICEFKEGFQAIETERQQKLVEESQQTQILDVQNEPTSTVVSPVGRDSSISQNARTKLKKAESDFTKWNKVTLSREKISDRFKWVAEKTLKRENMRC